MARTFIRQDIQIGSTNDTLIGFNDAVSPAATMESAAGTVADDLNNLRSMVSNLIDVQANDWYTDAVTPATLETGTQRGVNDLNSDLHAVEKKRVLREVQNLEDVTVGGADNFVILALSELPAQTTAAVGSVTTLGTVVAFHSGTFGQHSLDEVAGPTAVSPLNLVHIIDATTHDPILSSGSIVYGLLQTETVTDGHTMTGTTALRAQISFVRVNFGTDDMEACPAVDIQGSVIHYQSHERVRLEDLNEYDFLGGGIVDIPAGTTVTRQVGYTNQGVTPVDLVTNATLDLEGAGLTWAVRDDLEASLFSIVEGSAGGTSQLNIHAAVDEFDVDAIVNNFDAGATIGSGGARPIAVGVTSGEIATTAGNLRIIAADEMYLDDVNQAGSTWAQTDGIKLSETTAEWDAFETAFGEVSLLNAIQQAYSGQIRTKVQATLTANVALSNDVNGPGTAHNNTDVDLAPFDGVTFNTDVDVFLNGELMRYTDDVVAGGTPAAGDLQFLFALKGTGTKPDQITVIVNGQ